MGAYRVHQPQPQQPGLFDPARYAGAVQTAIGPGTQWIIGQLAGIRPLSHSDRLRIALEHDGGVFSRRGDPNNQAHHIVETSNAAGQAILQRHGIDSDAAINGVLLPTEQPEYGPDLTLHRGSHTRAYRDCVNQALQAAEARAARKGKAPAQAVAKRLRQIRNVLLSNPVPINARVDADYDGRTNDAATVRQIFAANRLFRN